MYVCMYIYIYNVYIYIYIIVWLIRLEVSMPDKAAGPPILRLSLTPLWPPLRPFVYTARF